MRDSKGIEKWTEFEMARINQGVVVNKKKLSVLLKEAKPQCTTKGGEPYAFNLDILRRLAAVLCEEEDLQLPITICFSTAEVNSSFVSDEAAADVLRRLEHLGEAYHYKNGKMWLPNSLAYALLMKYATAIQAMMI